MVENPRAATGAGRLRRLNEPRPLAIEAGHDGTPKTIPWRGGYRRVAAVHESWRIDDEWWRDEVSRRYYAIELDDGSRLVVYRDLICGGWYAQPYHGPKTAAGRGASP